MKSAEITHPTSVSLTVSRSLHFPPFSMSASCHLVRRGSPAARIVSFRTVTGAILANSATLSWGRKELALP